ncbi:MAG: hypothetical protein LBG80_02320, partial [Bacteroidales bacterium]|nr:hypothetical protein [Bacteroidales bacterium]
ACLDRANEVEPRPNEDRTITSSVSKSRRDNTLLTVCFSLWYGVALKKSRRDDISVENSTLSIKKSRRDDMSGRGRDKTCFAPCSEINTGIACLDRANEVEPRPNEGIK